MTLLESVKAALEKTSPGYVDVLDYPVAGVHLEAGMEPSGLRSAVTVLDGLGFFLDTITGIDLLGFKKPVKQDGQAPDGRDLWYEKMMAIECSGVEEACEPDHIECVYDFGRYDQALRVALRVRMLRDQPSLPTISDIYPGAHWHERETHDFFGIVFEGHPYLVPLLLPEDADFHPLRKDYKP